MSKYSTYIITEEGERVDMILDRSANRRKFALAINEGRLTVRVPARFDPEEVKRFIEQNLDWIHKNLELSAQKSGLPRSFEDGEQIRLLGEPAVIRLVNTDSYFSPRLENGELKVAVYNDRSREYVSRQVMGFITSLAGSEISGSMKRLTAMTGLYPKKVTVKDMNASWGRCSSTGNISINYKVVTFSKRHIDYVCMHELAHLVHMDHSAQFWALVEKYIPDWKQLRRGMR